MNETDLAPWIDLIRKYLGPVSAKMYAEFYRNEPPQVVERSVEEFLSEALGATYARRAVDSLRERLRSSV